MFLQSPGAENYYTLLWDYLAAFNLGHEQGGREPLPYDLYPYLFGLLAQFGDREREIGFYADKLLEIDPFLIDDEDGEVQARYWFGYRLYSRVMQRLFAEFGLVQTRSEQDKGQAFQDRCFVQRTPPCLIKCCCAGRALRLVPSSVKWSLTSRQIIARVRNEVHLTLSKGGRRLWPKTGKN